MTTLKKQLNKPKKFGMLNTQYVQKKQPSGIKTNRVCPLCRQAFFSSGIQYVSDNGEVHRMKCPDCQHYDLVACGLVKA